jgi:putative hydrolase of the HAD superfamily
LRLVLKAIIFDLDETLYPRRAGLMQEIGARIMRYLIERMGFSPQEAEARRGAYYLRYGTSLRGLMVEETVDPEDYLSFVHDIDLSRYIGPRPDLDAMLARIPLQKAIFTNATVEHARRVLAIVGIARHFATIVDIRAVDYISKPDPRAYVRLVERLGEKPEACILVEDNPRNLVPATALGMTTILVDHQDCHEVDFCVPDVVQVGDVVAHLLDAPGAHP